MQIYYEERYFILIL